MQTDKHNADQGLQMRTLRDAELEQVDGGILPFLVAALAFEAGMPGTVVAADDQGLFRTE